MFGTKSKSELHKPFSQTKPVLVLDPLYRKSFEEAVTHPIEKPKDPSNYNFTLISAENRMALLLMAAGHSFESYRAGDGIRFLAKSENNKFKSEQIKKNVPTGHIKVGWLQAKLKSAINKDEGDYLDLPFCEEISSELFVKYLLRSEATDTYEKIMSETEQLIRSFMKPEDWSILKQAMKIAETRFNQTKIRFLNPLDGYSLGEKRDLSFKEKETYGLPTDELLTVDIRSEHHDLICLKELLFTLKGEEASVISPFAGAFNKYLPELMELGYRAVVFKTDKFKLISIKLVKSQATGVIPYSPFEAGTSVLEAFSSDTFPIQDNRKYYVSVLGAVITPSDPSVHGYHHKSEIPILDKVVIASETFVIQSNGRATRLYFYPVNPNDVHPHYQTGTVIFGDSDQMFNSVLVDPQSKYFNKEVREDYSTKILETHLDNEPAIKAVHKLFLDSHVPPECMHQEYIRNEIGNKDEESSNSIYGENIYTAMKLFRFFSKSFGDHYEKLITQMEQTNLIKRCYPLTSRFLLFKYWKWQNSGLTDEAQPTLVRRIPAYSWGKVTSEFLCRASIITKRRSGNESKITDDENHFIKTGELRNPAVKDITFGSNKKKAS